MGYFFGLSTLAALAPNLLLICRQYSIRHTQKSKMQSFSLISPLPPSFTFPGPPISFTGPLGFLPMKKVFLEKLVGSWNEM